MVKLLLSYLKTTVIIISVLALMVFFLMLPIHNEYDQRGRASESYRAIKEVALSVIEHYSEYRDYPYKITNFNNFDDVYAGDISFDYQTGLLSVLLAGDSPEEGVLVLFPLLGLGGELTYRCVPIGVPNKFSLEQCNSESPVISNGNQIILAPFNE